MDVFTLGRFKDGVRLSHYAISNKCGTSIWDARLAIAQRSTAIIKSKLLNCAAAAADASMNRNKCPTSHLFTTDKICEQSARQEIKVRTESWFKREKEDENKKKHANEMEWKTGSRVQHEKIALERFFFSYCWIFWRNFAISIARLDTLHATMMYGYISLINSESKWK